MRRSRERGSAGGVIFGLAWIAVVLWIAIEGFRDSMDEAALMQRGITAPGIILRAWEECERGDGGKVWQCGVTYRYQLPDGRVLEQNQTGSGRLRSELHHMTSPLPVQVTYLPDNPNVSQISGLNTVKAEDWLLRKTAVSVIFLALFLTPGIWIFVQALRNNKDNDAESVRVAA